MIKECQGGCGRAVSTGARCRFCQRELQRLNAARGMAEQDRRLMDARSKMSVAAIATASGVSKVAIYGRLKGARKREQIRQEAGI